MNQMTLRMKNTATHPGLFLALELSEKSWTLLFGDGVRVREVAVRVGDVEQVMTEVAKARQKFGLPTDSALLSCHEAGRDGFWVHRALEANGFKNLVIDPASIEVDRRMRRAKTDKLDARKLLQQLIRQHRGETNRRTSSSRRSSLLLSSAVLAKRQLGSLWRSFSDGESSEIGGKSGPQPGLPAPRTTVD